MLFELISKQKYKIKKMEKKFELADANFKIPPLDKCLGCQYILYEPFEVFKKEQNFFFSQFFSVHP